ncbi:4-phosphoerythronate dehydrogenase PdxB [Candidatus Pseudomonas adelgestsugas]|uniref:Erythronate-4-phosphate dehydrogenase n=1 Tax=Candidatus Pseudomonas adelgestsugas TaxID=1302376 RepID=A0ABX5R9Q9_9PSED|nr:4-phosphoerythronate dehydrogenase PdxB [Candidatus Pseudomonas adelgestsugas]QAX82041.1 Erythronate-4-phosphate dehydrogenase [Candidatus Pseudomonas adelgestsugas]
MLIVADENISLLDVFFQGFGEIHRVSGRSINHATVKSADVLLVRSVTNVDRTLLTGTKVRFVGTCTIGTDHLDLDYFQQAGIAWSSAPGCNARGVVDYVLSSLQTLAEITGANLSQCTYGIVGVGKVGGLLLKVFKGLGWNVLACDPLLQIIAGGDYVNLTQIIEQCDVISLHTPLTKSGNSSTWHLFDRQRLNQLRLGAWLINASRGQVVDNAALREVLLKRDDLQVVLDVWDGEPEVDVDLADLCALATPHIAGSSLDGKQRSTAKIYQALCVYLGQEPSIQLSDFLPQPWLAEVHLDASTDLAWALAILCRSVYDPRRDDADFRRSLVGTAETQRKAFDLLRNNYPERREIDSLKVHINGQSTQLMKIVSALGAITV